MRARKECFVLTRVRTTLAGPNGGGDLALFRQRRSRLDEEERHTGTSLSQGVDAVRAGACASGVAQSRASPRTEPSSSWVAAVSGHGARSQCRNAFPSLLPRKRRSHRGGRCLLSPPGWVGAFTGFTGSGDPPGDFGISFSWSARSRSRTHCPPRSRNIPSCKGTSARRLRRICGPPCGQLGDRTKTSGLFPPVKEVTVSGQGVGQVVVWDERDPWMDSAASRRADHSAYFARSLRVGARRENRSRKPLSCRIQGRAAPSTTYAATVAMSSTEARRDPGVNPRKSDDVAADWHARTALGGRGPA
jgi:hypothetical protein